jgi:hypothetical protein
MTRLTRVATTLIPLLLLGVLNLALSGEATPASQPGDTPTGRVCVLRDFSPTDGGPAQARSMAVAATRPLEGCDRPAKSIPCHAGYVIRSDKFTIEVAPGRVPHRNAGP